MTLSSAFVLAADMPVYVAGHNGMVGSALVRRLHAHGCRNLIVRRHRELDLTDQAAVQAFFAATRPQVMFIAAAKVGGILANSTLPASFIYENIMIEANLIEAARRFDVQKVVFLGSSCIYPRQAPQPIAEDALLSGPLEPTNQWYAVAKIAGIKLGQAYRQQYGMSVISAMPTNLYGPNDNYHPEHSHVLPALLRRFHMAKLADAAEVVVWGSGKALREFLHVDDLADACVFLCQHYDEAQIINIGSGQELSIAELATMIGDVVGFRGKISFDHSKPDGTPRKLLDMTRLHELGWRARIGLRQGLEQTYELFCQQQQQQ